MADIVGSIGPAASLKEAPAWQGASRIIVLEDSSGVRHGRVEWLASEIDEDFKRALFDLYAAATRRRQATSHDSSSVS
jgi:hypothetical protein